MKLTQMSMKNGIRILAVLAVVQLALTLLTHSGGSSLAQHRASEKLLSFDKTQVDTLIIRGKDGFGDKAKDVTLTLHKKEGKWLTSDDFPAAEGKVERLLDKLKDLKHGLPVATTSNALTRFKVAKDQFERQIQLQHGDKTLATLYLGSGAGARQSHARNANDNAIYTVSLGSYDAPVKAEDWQDHGILKLSSQDISQVTLDHLTFKPDSSANQKGSLTIWQADQLPEGKMVNQKAINDSLKSLASLSFSKVLGKQAKPEYGFDHPALKLTVTHKGEQRQYTFGKPGKDDNYVLKVSDKPQYFEIASYTAKPLIEGISKDKWLLDKPKPEPATEAEKAPTKPEQSASDAKEAGTETSPATASEPSPQAEKTATETETETETETKSTTVQKPAQPETTAPEQNTNKVNTE